MREIERHEVGEDKEAFLDDNASVSEPSTYAVSFKEDSLRKTFGNHRTQINTTLGRIRKMEEDYRRQKDKVKLLQQQLEVGVRRGERQRERVRILEKAREDE